jgi:hypothetical protein
MGSHAGQADGAHGQGLRKGKLWAALLFFFPFVTTLILGFGKAEYLGVPEEKKQQDPPGEA